MNKICGILMGKQRNGKICSMDKRRILVMFFQILLLFVLIICTMYAGGVKEEVPYLEFMKYAKDGKVKSVDISLVSKEFSFVFKDGEKREEKKEEKDKNSKSRQIYTVPNPKYDDFKKDMLELGIQVNEKTDRSSYVSYILSGSSLVIMIAMFQVFRKKMNGDDDIVKRKEQMDTAVTFADVAGLDELKKDMCTIVDFLKSPQKYKDAGARLPKGVMLYGPPGTGKTLFAKAVAGEAGVSFIPTSGSEFNERYVGVGAQRIRKLFEDAKKKAPCIIFIDEIDSLGGKRAAADSSSDRQSVNQLLSEMDGFSSSDGILVIAATNRLEDLDSALVRPGRFDSHFAVPLPSNTKDRISIINLYMKNKKAGEDFDIKSFAKETLGCSPAEIQAVINEAAILAAQNSSGIITKSCIDDAFYKQIMKGHKKENKERKKEEIRIVAWHEAGHAVAGILTGREVTKATIIPSTSGAGGVTFFNNEKMGLFSKKELEEKIISLYAGRAAEELLVGKDMVTTGASNDIEKATDMIKSYICDYGMSQAGMIDISRLEPDSETILSIAQDMSQSLYERTVQMLKEHIKELDAAAALLMEKETVSGDELRKIIGQHCEK